MQHFFACQRPSLEQLLSPTANASGQVAVEQTKDAAVTIVTLNRPEVHNSIRLEMWTELADVIRGLGSRTQVIILRGAGRRGPSVSAPTSRSFPPSEWMAARPSRTAARSRAPSTRSVSARSR